VFSKNNVLMIGYLILGKYGPSYRRVYSAYFMTVLPPSTVRLDCCSQGVHKKALNYCKVSNLCSERTPAVSWSEKLRDDANENCLMFQTQYIITHKTHKNNITNHTTVNCRILVVSKKLVRFTSLLAIRYPVALIPVLTFLLSTTIVSISI
jgi:hypothetical protein